MTQPAANCPNCGAKLTFSWSSSVQTTCPYCKSILVRTDVDLKKVGQVADLPPNSSPIQIGTEGIFESKSFHAIGRIVYDYELGSWNEWHIVTNDGRSMWLSDAQNEFAVTTLAEGLKLPDHAKLNESYTWNGIHYKVTSITDAHYRGVEGELPFEYWDAEEAMFADLRSETAQFATLDYSDEKPALYIGKLVDFDELHMKNLRSFEGWQ